MTAASSRPLTPAARKQSWRELPVRACTVLTLGVLIVIAVVGIKGISTGLSDRQLIASGTRVKATVEDLYGFSRNVDRSTPKPVKLSYAVPDDPTDRRELTGMLSPLPGKTINHKDVIDIYVDNVRVPRNWTDRAAAPSWLSTLTVPLLLTPLLILFIGITVWQRSRVLRLFREGSECLANIVDAHKSAIVPGGRVIKAAPVGGDGRVLTMTQPSRTDAPAARGTQATLIVDDLTKPRRAILASAYQ